MLGPELQVGWGSLDRIRSRGHASGRGAPPTGGQWLLWLLLAAVVFGPHILAQSNDDGFLAALGELRDASFVDKERIVERLSQSGHPSARPVLAAFLEDRLYVRSQDQKIFIVKSTDESLASLELVDPLSLKDGGSALRDALTRIGTNNGLRRLLRTTVARFDLSSPDSAVRLAAAEQMLRSLDDASLALLRGRVGVETNAEVKEEI